MGQDLDGLVNNSLGQPMAQIFLNSFGQNGALAMWSFIVLSQYMMGSSMVCFESCPQIRQCRTVRVADGAANIF
jgi:hypothetical protein